MTDIATEVRAYADAAKAKNEAARQRVRAAAPDFFALIDRHYDHARQSAKLRALVTADGQEFGAVTDDMRARARG